MHFNKVMEIIPLLIFPDDSIKNDENLMRPIKYHPIWFLDSQEKTKSENIGLIYDGKVYFGKKFKIFLKTEKKIAKNKEQAFDMIILIMVLREKMNSYGKNYLKIISEIIIKNFEGHFRMIITSEILKENFIETPKRREVIKEGDFLKEKIKTLLNDIREDYFSLVNYSQKNNLINLEM